MKDAISFSPNPYSRKDSLSAVRILYKKALLVSYFSLYQPLTNCSHGTNAGKVLH